MNQQKHVKKQTEDSDIPRHLLTIDEAEILKKVVLHSVATALASIVWNEICWGYNSCTRRWSAIGRAWISITANSLKYRLAYAEYEETSKTNSIDIDYWR